MSALQVDVWADILAWAITTAPVFIVHHLLLRRHVTKVTARQTRDLKGDAGGDHPA